MARLKFKRGSGMCSLCLIPAPGPRCRLLLFLQRQFQGFPKQPHSEHCSGPTHARPSRSWQPGGQGSQGTTGAMGLFSPSGPYRLLLCKEAAPQHQHWTTAVCTTYGTMALCLCEGLRAWLASPGPSGVKRQTSMCVSAVLKHSEEGNGRT